MLRALDLCAITYAVHPSLPPPCHHICSSPIPASSPTPVLERAALLSSPCSFPTSCPHPISLTIACPLSPPALWHSFALPSTPPCSCAMTMSLKWQRTEACYIERDPTRELVANFVCKAWRSEFLFIACIGGKVLVVVFSFFYDSTPNSLPTVTLLLWTQRNSECHPCVWDSKHWLGRLIIMGLQPMSLV